MFEKVIALYISLAYILLVIKMAIKEWKEIEEMVQSGQAQIWNDGNRIVIKVYPKNLGIHEELSFVFEGKESKISNNGVPLCYACSCNVHRGIKRMR